MNELKFTKSYVPLNGNKLDIKSIVIRLANSLIEKPKDEKDLKGFLEKCIVNGNHIIINESYAKIIEKILIKNNFSFLEARRDFDSMCYIWVPIVIITTADGKLNKIPDPYRKIQRIGLLFIEGKFGLRLQSKLRVAMEKFNNYFLIILYDNYNREHITDAIRSRAIVF